MTRNIPYNEMDENIVELVRAMNALPGISTIGSCGGHKNPDEWQRPENEWFVSFRVAPSKGGWRSLELLANLYIFVFGDTNAKTSVEVYSNAVNQLTGRSLSFALDGQDCDPNEVAEILKLMVVDGKLTSIKPDEVLSRQILVAGYAEDVA